MNRTNCIYIDVDNYEDKVIEDGENNEIPQINGGLDFAKERWIWIAHDINDLRCAAKATENSLVILVLSGDEEPIYPLLMPKEFISKLKAKKAFIVKGGGAHEQAKIVGENIDIDKYVGWSPVVGAEALRFDGVNIKEFYERLAEVINMAALNKSTLMRMSYQYLKNVFINAPIIDPRINVSDFKGCALNKPVLIVAAGPSLNKQMDILEKNKDLFVILAVDTSWPILKRNNITPDFVFAIDPGSGANWRRHEFDDETGLMIDAGCGPKVVWSTDKNHLWNSGNPQCLMLMSRLGVDLEFLPTGGSVATTAFNFARHIGGAPIVLIGQDLALTDGKDHADGYLFSYSENQLRERSESGFNVLGYAGDIVRTEKQLLFYKTWYEKTLAENPELCVINSTEGGAKIQGALQIPFFKVCEELRGYSIQKEFSHLGLPSICRKEHVENLRKNLEEIVSDVESYREMAVHGMTIIETSKNNAWRQMFEEVDQINEKLLRCDPVARLLVDMFGFVKIDKIRSDIQNNDPNASFKKAAEKYLAIYKEVEQSSGYCLSLLQRVERFYSELDCEDPFGSPLIDEILADEVMNFQFI